MPKAANTAPSGWQPGRCSSASGDPSRRNSKCFWIRTWVHSTCRRGFWLSWARIQSEKMSSAPAAHCRCGSSADHLMITGPPRPHAVTKCLAPHPSNHGINVPVLGERPVPPARHVCPYGCACSDHDAPRRLASRNKPKRLSSANQVPQVLLAEAYSTGEIASAQRHPDLSRYQAVAWHKVRRDGSHGVGRNRAPIVCLRALHVRATAHD